MESVKSSKRADGFGTAYEQWKGWDAGAFGKYDDNDALSARAEFGTVDGVRVLEVGFGNGRLLKWFADNGASVIGVEANPELVRRALQAIPRCSAHDSVHAVHLDAVAGTLDLVVAIDVLEHIEEDDIVGFLVRLRSMLAPSGRIIVRYPNGDSPFGRIWQHGDVTHRTTIGHQKMRYFAEHASLRIVALRAPAEPILGAGPRTAVVRAARRAGRTVVDALLRNLYFPQARLPMTPLVVCELAAIPAPDAPRITRSGSST